jgi:aldehyde dehydrogenase (NAD+)
MPESDMKHYGKMFIDGEWVEPSSSQTQLLIDPYTEEPFATLSLATDPVDVDMAVAAARRAFMTYSRTPPADRAAVIDRIIVAYEARIEEFAEVIACEMGAPVSSRTQVIGPIGHMKVARDLLKRFQFETRIADTIIRREPIGVCGLISPWNWPVQTPSNKVIFALAAGCTVVLKPSEVSPLSAILLAEVLEQAGVPKGVFNLVTGHGSVIGAAIAGHPDVDLVSFTGSTGAGIMVGEAAARTVKKVALELGGKSANIVLPDADLEEAARWNIQRGFFNSGQSCHAPSRMLVHEGQLEDTIPYLVDECSKFVLGDPHDPKTTMGPLVNVAQFNRVQRYIRLGLEEGARLICGGLGRPAGMQKGYFTQPTVFVNVTPDMTVAREEIFGPVLTVLTYASEEEALKIANDTPYGLAGFVFSGNRKKAYELANGLRAGRICFNGANTNSLTPMGGYKQSGIGREMGVFGFEEYLEVKSVYGFEEESRLLPELPH